MQTQADLSTPSVGARAGAGEGTRVTARHANGDPAAPWSNLSDGGLATDVTGGLAADVAGGLAADVAGGLAADVAGGLTADVGPNTPGARRKPWMVRRIASFAADANRRANSTRGARPSRLRSTIILLFAGLAAGISIIAAALLLAVNLRARAIEDQQRHLASMALMIAAHTDSALQAIESVQTGLLNQMQSMGVTNGERYASLMTTSAMHQVLRDRISGLPFVSAVGLIDRDGKILNVSGFWPIPDISLADRQYFQSLRAGAATRYVSEPVQTRATAAWTFYLAQRFDSPDGSFLGIVLSSIELAYFQNFFAEVAPEADAFVSMMRRDGVMLVRHPAADRVIGSSLPSAGLQILADGFDHGTARTVSPVDAEEHLIAVHGLSHFPLAVIIGRTVAATLQPWRDQMRYLGGIAALLDAGVAGLVLLGMHQLRNRDLLARAELWRTRAEAERAAAEANGQNERALAAYYARFNAAVNNLSQGLCMFDRDDRLIIFNPRLAEIFEMPPDSLGADMSLARVMRTAIRGRAISLADVRRIRKDLVAVESFPEHGAAVWDVASGRALSVTFETTTERGWLMTFEDITQRRRSEEQISHMARHDALTGLPNRLLFHERMVSAVALAERGVAQAALCLDLDRFKDVNDTLGHPIGDALLQAVTARILRCVRETDTVARLGGDEFAIIVSPMRQSQDANVLADRLIEELGLPYDISGHQVVVGASIGIAIIPDDGLTPDMLLKNADLALYRAKGDGRGCYRHFKPEMDAMLRARRLLELDLRRAFALQEFELYYQPLVHIDSRQVCAFEALLRWSRIDRPPIGPGEFIPVAEEMGLIIPLGKWILETACNEAMSWPNRMAVAVNLSPVQFKSRQIVEMVRAALDNSGLQPDRLELEITETVLLEDTTETLATLHQLRALGVRISMDDFGTGYSSLSYLLKFPFDKVKIDRSFMARLGEGGSSDAIIRAVTGMCHDLGMETIAEGVETREQLAFLQQRQCTEVQGFLFSRAVPGSEVAALLAAFAQRGTGPSRDFLSLAEVLHRGS
jgi:diguanylate cyclase (GGDEF)-like protein